MPHSVLSLPPLPSLWTSCFLVKWILKLSLAHLWIHLVVFFCFFFECIRLVENGVRMGSMQSTCSFNPALLFLPCRLASPHHLPWDLVNDLSLLITAQHNVWVMWILRYHRCPCFWWSYPRDSAGCDVRQYIRMNSCEHCLTSRLAISSFSICSWSYGFSRFVRSWTCRVLTSTITY